MRSLLSTISFHNINIRCGSQLHQLLCERVVQLLLSSPPNGQSLTTPSHQHPSSNHKPRKPNTHRHPLHSLPPFQCPRPLHLRRHHRKFPHHPPQQHHILHPYRPSVYYKPPSTYHAPKYKRASSTRPYRSRGSKKAGEEDKPPGEQRGARAV